MPLLPSLVVVHGAWGMGLGAGVEACVVHACHEHQVSMLVVIIEFSCFLQARQKALAQQKEKRVRRSKMASSAQVIHPAQVNGCR